MSRRGRGHLASRANDVAHQHVVSSMDPPQPCLRPPSFNALLPCALPGWCSN